jgi:hypothetical protein
MRDGRWATSRIFSAIFRTALIDLACCSVYVQYSDLYKALLLRGKLAERLSNLIGR